MTLKMILSKITGWPRLSRVQDGLLSKLRQVGLVDWMSLPSIVGRLIGLFFINRWITDYQVVSTVMQVDKHSGLQRDGSAISQGICRSS